MASPAAPGQWKNLDANGNAVNISDFVEVLLHQQRLWFVAVNSTKAYYADIAAVGGTLLARCSHAVGTCTSWRAAPSTWAARRARSPCLLRSATEAP
jgi:hypothetical protein